MEKHPDILTSQSDPYDEIIRQIDENDRAVDAIIDEINASIESRNRDMDEWHRQQEDEFGIVLPMSPHQPSVLHSPHTPHPPRF
jgi:hypothetical protein